MLNKTDMLKLFKLNDSIQEFEVNNEKVLTTITLNDSRITNPTLQQFFSIGWKEYIEPKQQDIDVIEDTFIPTLEDLVEQKIREKYSINQEFEVQRKRDTEPEAFEEYYNFVEQCIAQAKAELNIE